MANEQLTAIYSQHITNLNRVATKEGNEVLPYLDNIYSGIAKVFANYYGRKRITPELQQKIHDEVSVIVRQELQGYVRELKKEQRELGIYEAEFSAKQLNDVILDEDFESNIPTAAQITAAAVSSPIKIGEDSYITYNTMMRNYWSKWTDEIDAVVAQGFAQGGTVAEIQKNVLDTIKPTKTGLSKSTLDRSRRQAKSIAITGTNHYANQARVSFAQDNLDVIKGYVFISVIDSRTSQQCRALDDKKIKTDDPKLKQLTPPIHPNCRSALVYEVDERYSIKDEDSKRSSRFRVDGKLEPKPINANQTYYEAMAKLSAKYQDAILGPTLGKAFRKLDNPAEFAKFTIDSVGQPLTITEMKTRNNALSKILNKRG